MGETVDASDLVFNNAEPHEASGHYEGDIKPVPEDGGD
jgi:hypothetical protein